MLPEHLQPPSVVDRSQPLTLTYMIGVLLAVNAIRDAFALVEGPDCVHMKTQYIQGNHDWLSTLTSVSGVHRIANTALHPVQMSSSREGEIDEFLRRMTAHPEVPGVVFTSMPMAFLTGADYDGICRDVERQSGKPVIHVKGKSLSGDWLDGYEETLLSFAQRLPLNDAQSDPRKVAVIGNLFDRNEGDHTANVTEIRRLIAGLGLDPVSIWFDGGSLNDLVRAREASTVVSLPYGRKAARRVAQRTGASLVECDLPFGIGASERFVREIARATGTEEASQRLVDDELAHVIPRLEFVVPYVFQGGCWGFIGDPHLALGIKETADLVGSSLGFAVITNPKHHCRELRKGLGDEVDLEVFPRQRRFQDWVERRLSSGNVQVVISTSEARVPSRCAVVEFGFPSFYAHCLFERPYLGFRGCLAFLDTISNAIRRHEVQIAEAGNEKPRSGRPDRNDA